MEGLYRQIANVYWIYSIFFNRIRISEVVRKPEHKRTFVSLFVDFDTRFDNSFHTFIAAVRLYGFEIGTSAGGATKPFVFESGNDGDARNHS